MSSDSNANPTITLFGHSAGPNPWKVAILLEELGVSYKISNVDFKDIKQPSYTKYNPNGRVPAIIDHSNGDFVLWESNAILEYISDRFDKQRTLSVDQSNAKERALQSQWLYFQASGQGPYFGQAAWFTWYHPEQIPSAKERYIKEIKRVTGVLNDVLANKPFLLGSKATIADLSFVPWYELTPKLLSEGELEKEYPNFGRWINELRARPNTKKVLDQRNAAIAASQK